MLIVSVGRKKPICVNVYVLKKRKKSIKMPHVKRKVCGEVFIKVMIALTWNENKCQILDVLLIMKVT